MHIASMIRLMRPKHWVKNVLVCLPALFAGRLLDSSCLYAVSCGFFAFSLLASAAYVFNDILDVEADRRSPTKSSRPLASGEVSVGFAVGLMLLLTCGGLLLSYVCGGSMTTVVGCLYVLENVFYSCWLKRVPLVDVWVLASFYVVRVLFGSVVSGVDVSGWMWLCVMSGALWLGFGKRLGELRLSGSSTRAVLASYNDSFLSKASWMSLTLTLAFYALWAREGGFLHLCSVPLVLFIVMRYEMVAETSKSRDPIGVALSDRMLVGTGVIWLLFVSFVVYGGMFVTW